MAGWYRVVKTIKGHRYLYAQRTWREGGHVRTQSRYLGKADDGSASSSGHSAQAGLSDTGIQEFLSQGIKETYPSTPFTIQEIADAERLGLDLSKVTEPHRVEARQQLDFRRKNDEVLKRPEYNKMVKQDYENAEKRRVAQQPIDDQKTLAQRPSSRGDIYEEITDRIISDIERGVRPWDKPWQTGTPSMPFRFNGERYHGINILILWLTAQENGYSSPYWMTFKQAQELGGLVRKGEKGTGITYASKLSRLAQDKEGELIYDEQGHELIEDIPFLKSYTVFNADQIEGLPEKVRQSPTKPLDPETRIQKVDEIVKGTGAEIRYGGNQAYNSVDGNYIQMPPYEHFKQPEGFAATIMHELVHWTRHPSRLNREFGRERFGDEGYAMEELVAELGAAFLCAEFGISPKTRGEHSSYVASWLKVLKNDKRAIFTAAAHAQRAVEYLTTVSSITRAALDG